MADIANTIRIMSLTLLFTELGCILFRSRRFVNKREVLLFASILLTLCLKLIFIENSAFQYVSTFLLIILFSQLLFLTMNSKRQMLFTVSSLAGLLAIVCLIPVGISNRPVFIYFYIIQCGFFALISMYNFFSFIRKIKKHSLIPIFIVLCLLLILGGAEHIVFLQFGLQLHISQFMFLFLGIAFAFLVFEEGYFSQTGFTGLFHRLNEEEQRSREAFLKLSETEAHMIAQDRFVSMGVLAAGLTHEFKNMLGLVKSLADYGIAVKGEQKKEECLHLIKENTETNMTSVIGILENIKSNKLQNNEKINVSAFFMKFIKIVKANYRRTGIDISLQIDDKYSVVLKRNDLEQLMLNIIRNAAAALKKLSLDQKMISINVFEKNNRGFIEIRDNAGGVPEETAFFLFEQHGGSSDSTGVGLYLSKLLAEQNNASIKYENRDNESRFLLTFTEIYD